MATRSRQIGHSVRKFFSNLFNMGREMSTSSPGVLYDQSGGTSGDLMPSSSFDQQKKSEQHRLGRISDQTIQNLKTALDYLSATSLKVEGLYRISGDVVSVAELASIIKMGDEQPPLSWEVLDAYGGDKHVIACAVKKVLQQHEPVLTYDLYQDFLDVPRTIDDRESDHDGWNEEMKRRQTEYSKLLQRLPPPCRDLLFHILAHLHKVEEASTHNKMTFENLAKTIGTHLLRKSELVEDVDLDMLEKDLTVILDLLHLPLR